MRLLGTKAYPDGDRITASRKPCARLSVAPCATAPPAASARAGVTAIGRVRMQLQRLACVQKDRKVPADLMRLHPEDRDQKRHLARNVPAQ